MAVLPSAPAARPRHRGRAAVVALTAALLCVACSREPGTGDPGAERGRQIYLAQCIACHNSDPSLAGPVGPPVRGSTRELLEAKLLKGTYPPSYAPKRPTNLMPPPAALAPEIPNLAAYLK